MKIDKCRISGSTNLISVLNLGEQFLTGVFPKTLDEKITKGPLELVWCPESELLQLSHSYDLDEMYGDNYGYRSGLNSSMVAHLKNKVKRLESLVPLNSNDVVLDIGSNDGTLLASYRKVDIQRVGIDPTGLKFREYYEDKIRLIPKFFSETVYKKEYRSSKAKIITAISMFYDLEDPKEFVSDVVKILHPEGIFHLEQSYMPAMLRMNSYDTVCHEHLEYYSLTVLKKILEENNLKIVDVIVNSVNGGSFAVSAAHAKSSYQVNYPILKWMLDQEKRLELNTIRPYINFQERVSRHREDLIRLINELNKDGKTVVGYGASTKGNVLLQYCGFTDNDIRAIAEINPDKYGCFTPGSLIPIKSEKEVKSMKPDYMLVLPWHFKESIISREKNYLEAGGKLIFPLPDIEIIQ